MIAASNVVATRFGEAIGLEWNDVLVDRLRLRDSKTGPRDFVVGALVLRFPRAPA